MNFKIKKSEFDHFSKLASEWWLKNGKFKILHEIQPIRIKYIQNLLNREQLNKMKILDLGCGGGLVSEGLSKIGGNVTGIDFVKDNINIARIHAKKSNICLSLDLTRTEDIIVNLIKLKDYIIMVKLHCDIIENFNDSFVKQLVEICERNNYYQYFNCIK